MPQCFLFWQWLSVGICLVISFYFLGNMAVWFFSRGKTILGFPGLKKLVEWMFDTSINIDFDTRKMYEKDRERTIQENQRLEEKNEQQRQRMEADRQKREEYNNPKIKYAKQFGKTIQVYLTNGQRFGKTGDLVNYSSDSLTYKFGGFMYCCNAKGHQIDCWKA